GTSDPCGPPAFPTRRSSGLQQVADLIARDAIRTLIHTYAEHGDRGRLDDLVGLFTEDATLDVAGGTYVGHDAILGFYRGLTSSRSEEHTSELQSRDNLVCRL